MAHLCGLCLALRDGHGQFARIATNYDGLIISVLTEAQAERARRRAAAHGGALPAAGHAHRAGRHGRGRAAGRGRLAGARLGQDARPRRRRGRGAAGGGRSPPRPAGSPAAGTGPGRGPARTSASTPRVLVDAVGPAGRRSRRAAGPGTPLLTVTEPTETATAAAFAHTAVLAGRPANAGAARGGGPALRTARPSAGRGRGPGGRTPAPAPGTRSPPPAPPRAEAAPARATTRCTASGWPCATSSSTAGQAGASCCSCTSWAGRWTGPSARRPAAHAHGPQTGPAPEAAGGAEGAFGPPTGPYAPHNPADPNAPHPPGNPYGNPYGGEPPRPQKRGFLAGCAVAIGLCCTCKVCCADEFEGPWSRKRREGWCSDCGDCDGGCCDCCDACECCECCACDCSC